MMPFYRNLDPQIGRFYEDDPESGTLESYSPYELLSNNPILNLDPLGNFATRFGTWWYRLLHGGGSIKQNEYGEWYVNKSKNFISSNGTPTVNGYRYYGKGRNQYTAAGENQIYNLLLSKLPYVSPSFENKCMEIFFAGKFYDPKYSGDQDFTNNYVFESEKDDFIITFGVDQLSKQELSSLLKYCDILK